ncbi:hypothetical protein ACNQO6_16030 [Acinetobacter calcoaceticus]|uniref:hypothetical protein n=1 Tax=Acinetobacter calcoaceticus TaxID=471 RepID=UPI002B2E6DDA|nr:hypothetical protein SB581_18385 [Acinetobacter baumannii]
MKFKNKRIPQVIATLLCGLGLQSLALAQDENTIGAEAYLSIKTWEPSEKYNAAHFLMVPLYYAYKNNDTKLKAKFNEHIEKFLADDSKNIDIVDFRQRLANFQYFYFLSEYAVLARNQELGDYLLKNIVRVWLDVRGQQWRMPPIPATLRERILWKLQAGPEVGYKRIITDEDIFIFGTASNLLKLYPENKTLIDIRDLALEVFKQRSEFNAEGGWLFDKGVFDTYPDYAYAGYNSTSNITKPKPLKNMVSDSSHFFRMPKILLSLQESYPENSQNYNLYKSYRNGLNQQFLNKVVHIKNNKIYLTNYMDGRNGVFRWNYNVKNKGIGPYEQTYSFGMGWWVFLDKKKVKDLYGSYYRQIKVEDHNCNSLMTLIIINKKRNNLADFLKCEFIYNSYLASKLDL